MAVIIDPKTNTIVLDLSKATERDIDDFVRNLTKRALRQNLGAGRVKFAQGLWHVMDGDKVVMTFRYQDEALEYARERARRKQL